MMQMMSRCKLLTAIVLLKPKHSKLNLEFKSVKMPYQLFFTLNNNNNNSAIRWKVPGHKSNFPKLKKETHLSTVEIISSFH